MVAGELFPGLPSTVEGPMLIPSSLPKWLRLPSRIALLLGLGALSAAGAKADTGEVYPGHEPARVPQQSVKTFGDLLIWSEGERIYVAEPGREAQGLPLGDTPETHRLRQLLQRDGATKESPRALRDRIILVGGGGEGFHWGPVRQPDGRGKTNGLATRAPDKPPVPGSTTSVEQAGVPEKRALDAGDPKK
jgi:hypothetical protein